MHIPDGIVSVPINLATLAIVVPSVSYAIWKTRKNLSDRFIPLTGIMAAYIFAAQMLNFPVLAGTSGHFLGAALAAIMLGPSLALIIMTLVLTIQCLGFADGGISSLSTNIFNMGILGSFSGYLIFISIQKISPRSKRLFILSAGIASWFSVVIAAVVVSFELSLSGVTSISIILPAMTGIYSFIGIGEALITCAVLAMVTSTRPDLIISLKST
jgi:cobalt/nickel transport system permease protein